MVAKQAKAKPKKPSKNFPLFAHSRGYWCKKFKGKQYNFGPWDDPQGALKAWKEFEAKHVLGMQPKTSSESGGATVVDMVAGFLDSKQSKVDRGDLSPRTLNQYVIAGRWLVDGIGRHRLIETIGPTDFTRLRNSFPAKWGTVFCDARIMHVRTMFKWAYDNDAIDRPVKYGSDWSKTPKKKVRLEQAKKESKEFTRKETLALLEAAQPQIKAMILLGLNAGYGNLDCARLKTTDVKGVWLDIPRGKNGQARRCWLWPETRDAIKAVIRDHDGEEPLFKTAAGNLWVDEDTGRNNLTKEFLKLRKKAGCNRKGVGFYSLRHMTETIASDADVKNVQPVIDLIMGHDDGTMASNYRESISDARVKRVCQHLRGWLFDV